MTNDSFIQRMAEHIKSHYDLAHQELTVVFPNKRAAFYLRDAIKKEWQQTIWLPQMLSIEEAVTQWSGMKLVDTIDLLFELIDIDAELHKEQNSNLSVFGSQAAQMAKDFDEIDQYDIDAHHLFNYVVENKKLEVWNVDEANGKEREHYLNFFTSLYNYYVRLRERLLAKQQGYYGMITRHLAHLSDQELATRIGERNIIFAGFNALTTTEERIIDKWVKMGKAEVIFDYDRYYIDDANNEAGLFARCYLTAHPDWMKNSISDRLSQEEKHIHIVSASGNVIQAKALQSDLQRNPEKNAAIILAEESLLNPVLNAIPDTATYADLKVSMGYPIKKTPVNQLVSSYFMLQRKNKITRRVTQNGKERVVEGWYLWPILQVMDSELVKITFTQEDLAVFERWKVEAVGKDKKFIFELQDIDSMEESKDMQTFLRLMLNETSQPTPQAVLHTLNSLLQFIANKIQSRKEKEQLLFLLNQVSAVGQNINRISQVIEQHIDYVSDINGLEILFKLLTVNSSIKLNSSSTDGLQIMGLLETRNIDFERLHVLSVNEGILPTDKSQESFIPHFIKQECGLPGYAEKQAVFAYHFYRLLQYGKDIYLYYNNLGELSGGEASRYILQIKHELSRYPNIHIEEETFSNDTGATAKDKTITAQKANATERIHYLLQEKGLSPSALSTYLSCPLKYYLKYVEQIKDNSLEEEIGADVVGTVTHKTLELLFKPYESKGETLQIIDKELFDNVIMPQWEAKLAQSVEEELKSGFPDVGFNYLNKITIRQQLQNYLKYTSRQLKDNMLAIIALEHELKAKCPIASGEVKLAGVSDRIDRCGGLTRVVDYKTGHVEPSDLKIPVRQRDETDLEFVKQMPEKAVQLLLYKYMYLKENPEVAPNQVIAAIHGLRYSNTIEFGLVQAKPTKNDDALPFLGDDSFIADMEALLKAVAEEMLNVEVPFVQTEDEKRCRNCDFKVICGR